jgi:hypothetical protein
MIVFIYMEQYIIFIKKNITCQDSNEMFNYRIKFKSIKNIYIKIMMCKIMRPAYVAQ